MKPGMTMRPLASITRGAAAVQIRPDGEDLLALDQDVGLGEAPYWVFGSFVGPSSSPRRRE